MTDPAKPTDATDSATPDQIERANRAVEVNLNDDGSRKYDSAQGYACALTAIMQADAMRALEPADSDGDGDAEELRGIATWLASIGAKLGAPIDKTVDFLDRIATRLEQHPGQGELVELRAERDKWKQRAFELECQFGDLKGVYVARADAPVGDANHD